jgi:hypothetical protein
LVSDRLPPSPFGRVLTTRARFFSFRRRSPAAERRQPSRAARRALGLKLHFPATGAGEPDTKRCARHPGRRGPSRIGPPRQQRPLPLDSEATSQAMQRGRNGEAVTPSVRCTTGAACRHVPPRSLLLAGASHALVRAALRVRRAGLALRQARAGWVGVAVTRGIVAVSRAVAVLVDAVGAVNFR